jgi:hypothetical protein
VQLAIAMSGARLDLGQTEAALVELQIPQLDPNKAFSWSPALFDAYAAVLEDLGREDEAEQWWQRSDRATDALGDGDGEDDVVEVVEEEFEDDEDGDQADVADVDGDERGEASAVGDEGDARAEHAEPERG